MRRLCSRGVVVILGQDSRLPMNYKANHKSSRGVAEGATLSTRGPVTG